MRNLFLSFCLVISGSLTATAQMPQSTPQQPTEVVKEEHRNNKLEMLQNRRLSGLNRRALLYRQEIAALYRKPSKDELKPLAPSDDDLKTYADFLRQPGTGLTRLAVDLGCADNTNVVVATEDCLKYKIPGAGSSFSFRTNSYRIRRLADLTFTDNTFQVTGVLLHGILVGIGNVPLEEVSLQTGGLNYLKSFQPAADYETAQKLDRQIVKGVLKDGYLYRRGLNALENMTYVLRSIAYDGRFYRAIQGLTYNELDFDKRRDVVVAFRIVRRDADGSVTILWKELSRTDAPEIKLKETQKKRKETKFVAENFNK